MGETDLEEEALSCCVLQMGTHLPAPSPVSLGVRSAAEVEFGIWHGN